MGSCYQCDSPGLTMNNQFMLNNNQLKQLNLWMPVIILTSVIFGGVMWVIYSITITAVILAVINLIKKLLNKKL